MPSVSLPELISSVCARDAIISFPTDTVPALATHPQAGQLLYDLKHRSPDKPLSLLGADAADLWPYVKGSAAELETWQEAILYFWPGPLTLVLPASPKVPAAMGPPPEGTIGIRVPNNPIARHILKFTGPLATTSANLSGKPPLLTTADIAQQFPSVLILSDEDLEQLESETQINPDEPQRPEHEHPEIETTGIPSTVAKWSQQGWEILRQGQVKL